jgi:hypothetical protein
MVVLSLLILLRRVCTGYEGRSQSLFHDYQVKSLWEMLKARNTNGHKYKIILWR